MHNHDDDMPEVASPQPAAAMHGMNADEASRSPVAQSLWQGQHP